jgi:predicted MFS family arabinose efflux permease
MRKWIQWLVPQLFFCLNLTGVVLYAVTSGSLGDSLKLTSAQIGGLGGAYFIAYALSQLFLGSSLGALPAKYLLGFTALISSAGALLLGIAQNYEMAMLARVLMGIGFGTAMVGVIYVIGQFFGNRFAFMVNLSQSAANAVGAAIGSFASIPLLQNFRLPHLITAALLLINGVLLLFVITDDDNTSNAHGNVEAPKTLPDQLSSIFSNGQYWIGTIYFTGLFATFLAYADLWNIKFQVDIFNKSTMDAAMINSGVAWGCTFGALISGIWANKVGFLVPARICAWMSLLLMSILYTKPLPGLALPLMVLLGLFMGAAPLGLAAMNAHISEKAKSVASAILLTFVFLCGGLLMSIVGSSLATLPVSEFSTYRAGMNWFLVPVAIAAVSSLLMKPGRVSS